MRRITKYWRALPVVPIVLTAAIFVPPVAAQDVDAKGGKELTELGQKIDKAADRAAPEQVILLALSNQSGKSVSDILAMRQSGEGWGELARDLKLKNLGSVIKSVKATEKGVDRVALQRSDRREDRLERAAKPDKPERMERPERPMRPEKPGR